MALNQPIEIKIVNLHNDIDVNALIKGCIQNNRKSQELLYRKFANEMYGLCKGYTNNTDAAKDILQEGFIKVFKSLNKYNGKGSLKSWIRRIIVNTAIDYYRKSARESKIIELETNNYYIASIENDILEQFSVEDILKLTKKLPNGARLIFNLHLIEGYTHKEIAKKLNISEGTSKSQFNRARNILQNLIVNLHEVKYSVVTNAN